MKRIACRYRTEGEAGLAHKSQGRESNRKLERRMKEEVLRLYREKYSNAWKDGEETKGLESTWNVLSNFQGEVFCENPNGGERREMAYGGFETTAGWM